MNFVFAYSANPADPFFLEHLEEILKQSKNSSLNILNETKLSNKKNGHHLFQKIKEKIDSADCLIAEVTNASLDVGGEIVYALMKGIPVLALIYKESVDNLTPMLANNPSEHLFLEHYDEKNLKFVIKEFVKHLEFLKNKKGKLVVIDGGDGSGKATQTEFLANYLKKEEINYRVYDFPRYYTSFHGAVVGRLLSGEFGTLNNISPYLASLAYALDRASVRDEMNDFLESGGVIICNRYTTSNMGHQGGRFGNPLEKQKFIKWLEELEYKIHKLPKEDVVVYLFVPWQIGYELTKKKAVRSYTKGKKMDMVEKDLIYRKNSEEMFLELCKTRKNWIKINCVEKGKLLSKEEIHQKIIVVLKDREII